MKITPQDIIDREFKVKFRGFDMAEVDAFLEEVAECFFKLNEENTLLNERIAALQEEMESGARTINQGQMELPAELENSLDELKQGTAAVNAEIASLKQDRSVLIALEKNLKEILGTLKETSSTQPSQAPSELPAELISSVKELKAASKAMAGELVSLKKEFQSFASLKKGLEDLAAAPKSGSGPAAQVPVAGGDLAESLKDLQQKTETIGSGLETLNQEINSVKETGEQIKSELLAQLKSYFTQLEAKLTATAPAIARTAETAKPKTTAAIYGDEADELPEDTRVPDYEDQADAADEEDDLEFLSEDDILDVDKLRDVFQSALGVPAGGFQDDDDGSEGELLFFDDDLTEDEHEPEVTYSLEENNEDSEQEKSGNA